ncbi:MAG: hypothetical protein EA352_11965 [Gemmatimonadales bacterium]|nr:MAG: hypothetical protein EA352_11965 [Gemmatimonadales bacterium]
MTLFLVLGAVAALLVGVWIGMPGRFRQTQEEIDERLESDGEHAKVRRRETFIGILQKKATRGSDRRRSGGRSPFRM